MARTAPFIHERLMFYHGFASMDAETGPNLLSGPLGSAAAAQELDAPTVIGKQGLAMRRACPAIRVERNKQRATRVPRQRASVCDGDAPESLAT